MFKRLHRGVKKQERNLVRKNISFSVPAILSVGGMDSLVMRRSSRDGEGSSNLVTNRRLVLACQRFSFFPFVLLSVQSTGWDSIIHAFVCLGWLGCLRDLDKEQLSGGTERRLVFLGVDI